MRAISRTFVSRVSKDLGRAPAGGHPCQGVYHAPSGRRPSTAIIATHYDVDFSEHYLAEPMAERGVGFLGWNTRFRGLGLEFRLDAALDDIAVGVEWLRAEAGVSTVVLLGNSGGASLMSAYQARALSDAGRAGSEAGDYFIALCAHTGRPDVLTSWLDPSVTDEFDPLSVDPELDMYDTANTPPYSEEFVARYRAAQVERNHRITAWALAELDRLQAAGGSDRVFSVPRTWADLRFLDTTIDPSDRRPGCYAGDPRTANYGSRGLASACTLRGWLEMWSLERSSCRALSHLPKITQPALVIQSLDDPGCYPSDARAMYDALAGTDKRLEFVPGDHYLRTPQNARSDVADMICEWLRERGVHG